MKQLTYYKYAIGSLVLLNLAILAFFILTKPRPPRQTPPHNFRSHAVNILHLNTEQEAIFNNMAKDHHQKMDALDRLQQELLLPYFQSLSISTIQVDEEMVLNEIQQLEKEKIQVTHQHFQDLKSILTSEQLPYFEVFTQEFINHVLLGGKKHSPPPKGF
jgi:hypothetical protein